MKLILPLTVTIPRKTKEDKVFHLNLNIYRNTHHMTLNKAKELYKDIVRTSCNKALSFRPEPPYHFIYTVFPANARKFDLANVLPIIQKFADDALIELGIISDDSWKVIQAIDYRIGGIDKENPRCELEILAWE